MAEDHVGDRTRVDPEHAQRAEDDVAVGNHAGVDHNDLARVACEITGAKAGDNFFPLMLDISPGKPLWDTPVGKVTYTAICHEGGGMWLDCTFTRMAEDRYVVIGTDLVNPNFAAMAEAVGIKGVRIEDPKDVDARIAEALAHPGPVVVDAVVNRQELAMPPAITAEMAKGFSLYMMKAILSGRGEEIVDLARTNLRR